jgi:hypothetical protein
MLIVEKTSNGRTMVRLHKDWHPNRISKGYQPPLKNYMTDSSIRLQTGLFKYANKQRSQS